jgi:L-proline amide hydrolase
MEYALTQPAGLASLIIASAHSSEPQSEVERGRLLKELPPQTGDMPEDGRTVFDLNHICRINTLPDFTLRSAAPEKLMRKPKNVAPLPGKDWDITARLGEIKVPTLITSGRYDMFTPAVMQMVKDGIPGSEWVLFEESSHYAHVEERQRYLAVVNDFLARVEQAATSGTSTIIP